MTFLWIVECWLANSYMYLSTVSRWPFVWKISRRLFPL